jgi:hypothetical protein
MLGDATCATYRWSHLTEKLSFPFGNCRPSYADPAPCLLFDVNVIVVLLAARRLLVSSEEVLVYSRKKIDFGKWFAKLIVLIKIQIIYYYYYSSF